MASNLPQTTTNRCNHEPIPRDKGRRPVTANKVLLEIESERVQQLTREGWTDEHDDQHELGEMAAAAGCYALAAAGNPEHQDPHDEWPWDWRWWKPTTARRNLVKAAALIVAEIERLDRVARQQE